MKEVTAIITQERARITCNFEQAEEAIQETLSEYKGAVFTEDSKTYAKKHVASLRAQKKTLQDNLRDEKKKYMEPWENFEVQAKKLIALYDDPINLINGQVQAFEEERIERKRQLICQIYGELVSAELVDYIPLDCIFDKRWENATTSEKSIRKDISEISEKTKRDISTIQGMESEAGAKALSLYKSNRDLTEAVSYINSYERQKQEILKKEEERIRREEEERIRRVERERILEEQRAREAQTEAIRQAELEKAEALKRAEEEKVAAVEQAKAEAAQEIIDSFIPDAGEDEEKSLFSYNVFASPSEKEKLEMFMDSVGIEWEVAS